MTNHALRSALVVVGFSVVAAASWKASALFRAKVHEHVFDKVEAYSQDCMLYSKVYFTAPPQAYADEAPVRNHYRFKALVRYASGNEIVSGVFFSRSAARRSYTIRTDTSRDGCWSRREQQPADVRIEGCRGEGCTVAPFE